MLPPSRETTATLGPWTPRLAGNHALCCTLRVADMDTTNNTIAGNVFVRTGAGIAEEAGSSLNRTCRSVQTIVRGVLMLPRDMTQTSVIWDRVPRPRAALIDAAGRKVLSLLPGKNDVSRLAPGVYFARRATGEGRVANSKVVVTR
jgi:hypothetical protein